MRLPGLIAASVDVAGHPVSVTVPVLDERECEEQTRCTGIGGDALEARPGGFLTVVDLVINLSWTKQVETTGGVGSSTCSPVHVRDEQHDARILHLLAF